MPNTPAPTAEIIGVGTTKVKFNKPTWQSPDLPAPTLTIALHTGGAGFLLIAHTEADDD